MVEPFEFKSRLHLVELTGRKARTVSELQQGIREASDTTIFHHTHRHLEQHLYLSPEPPNDFAHWVRHILGDAVLGEALASVDISQHRSIGELRESLVAALELNSIVPSSSVRSAPPGYEFQFVKAVTFVLPEGFVCHTLAEFAAAIEFASVHSLHFHIFEARLLLNEGSNHFSLWLANHLGENELARNIARLDPYTHTMEGLRAEILGLVRKRLEEQNAQSY